MNVSNKKLSFQDALAKYDEMAEHLTQKNSNNKAIIRQVGHKKFSVITAKSNFWTNHECGIAFVVFALVLLTLPTLGFCWLSVYREGTCLTSERFIELVEKNNIQDIDRVITRLYNEQFTQEISFLHDPDRPYENQWIKYLVNCNQQMSDTDKSETPVDQVRGYLRTNVLEAKEDWDYQQTHYPRIVAQYKPTRKTHVENTLQRMQEEETSVGDEFASLLQTMKEEDTPVTSSFSQIAKLAKKIAGYTHQRIQLHRQFVREFDNWSQTGNINYYYF